MKFTILVLLSLCATTFAAEKAAKAKGGIGADAPAGKPYIYKESAGKPRQMEIYFPPQKRRCPA